MKRRTILSAFLALPFGTRLLADCEVKGTKPVAVTYTTVKPGMHSLYVLGDFGTGGSLQKKVARAMNDRAARFGMPLAMISTGDNIYPGGVESATDAQWQTKFERIYALENLQNKKWVAVLGNHDYRGSVNAQIEYGKINKQWIMPSTYFVQPCPNAETMLTLFCLDTQAILKKSTGWKEQIQWLEHEVQQCKSRWKVVVGHHPLRSYGHYQDQVWLLDLIKPILDDNDVAAYLCGHDHDLQVIQNPNDKFTCIVSGSGGGCRSTTWGAHSKIAGTGGGFAVLQFDKSSMFAQVIMADGTEIGTVAVGSSK